MVLREDAAAGREEDLHLGRSEHAFDDARAEGRVVDALAGSVAAARGVGDGRGHEIRFDERLGRLRLRHCDWSNYRDAVREFHAQGIELIDIPQSKMSGKNSADIRMVVDALDLCYSKQHIDIFALLSGDSDFSPLVSKLKENNKRVIGCGVKSSTSDLLIANCDEFIYYDDLIRAAKKPQPRPPKKGGRPKEDKKQEAIDRVLEVVQSVEQDYDPLWGSMLKQAIRRVYPGFNEGYYGYGSFSDLLEDIKAKGLIELEYDDSRGNLLVAVVLRRSVRTRR